MITVNAEQLSRLGYRLFEVIHRLRVEASTSDNVVSESPSETMLRLLGLRHTGVVSSTTLLRYIQQNFTDAEAVRAEMLAEFENLKVQISEIDLSMFAYKDKRAELLTNADNSGTLDKEITSLEEIIEKSSTAMGKADMTSLPNVPRLQEVFMGAAMSEIVYLENKLDRLKNARSNIRIERNNRETQTRLIQESEDDISLLDFVNHIIAILKTLKFTCSECFWYDDAGEICSAVNIPVSTTVASAKNCTSVWSSPDKSNSRWLIADDSEKSYNSIDFLKEVLEAV